jgi:hypothetical protein
MGKKRAVAPHDATPRRWTPIWRKRKIGVPHPRRDSKPS